MTEIDLQRIETKLDSLASDVRTVKRHVVGESDPEHSLMYRVADHGRQLDELGETRKQTRNVAWTALGAGASAFVAWMWTKMTRP